MSGEWDLVSCKNSEYRRLAIKNEAGIIFMGEWPLNTRYFYEISMKSQA